MSNDNTDVFDCCAIERNFVSISLLENPPLARVAAGGKVPATRALLPLSGAVDVTCAVVDKDSLMVE